MNTQYQDECDGPPASTCCTPCSRKRTGYVLQPTLAQLHTRAVVTARQDVERNEHVLALVALALAAIIGGWVGYTICEQRQAQAAHGAP